MKELPGIKDGQHKSFYEGHEENINASWNKMGFKPLSNENVK